MIGRKGDGDAAKAHPLPWSSTMELIGKAELVATAEKLTAMNREFILARSDSSLYFFDYDNHVFELDTTDLGSELHGGD